MILPLTATALTLDGRVVEQEALGDAAHAVGDHLASAPRAGLVLLGPFGSGKSTLCARLASEGLPGLPPLTVVPLRVVARHAATGDGHDLEVGLRKAVGAQRIDEAQAGERILLLDGLDEIPTTCAGAGSFQELFDQLTTLVGPRFLLTSRPGWFRTAVEHDPDQVDTLSRSHIATWVLDPLPLPSVRATIAGMPDGRRRLISVEGMLELATSPVLYQATLAALPFIEPGRPIHPWGVFDAWIRHALRTGPRHDEAIVALEELAWEAYTDADYGLEVPLLSPERVAEARLPDRLRQALLVNELTGGLRFGHRSVYEFLLASRIAPRLAANQGHGPDELSGRRLTDAMRAFIVGRTGPMGVRFDRRAERAWIPRGNFIAGGDLSLDERPLRIQHLAEPVWLCRVPVTHADWARFLADQPDDRVDAHYLQHWGPDRSPPPDMDQAPIYNLWPQDADRYAAWYADHPSEPDQAGARLPTADEWEKAVRGIDGRRWPWGDHWRPAAAITGELGLTRPPAVRAFGAAGESALYGAAGGVFEYTSTWWRDREDRGREVMGGCFTHPASVSRASLRLSHRLSGTLKAGLRLAWDAPEPEP